MSIDKSKTRGRPDDETLFVIRDPEDTYTHSEVCELLEKAQAMGFSLEKGSELERFTVREIDILVNQRM